MKLKPIDIFVMITGPIVLFNIMGPGVHYLVCCFLLGIIMGVIRHG